MNYMDGIVLVLLGVLVLLEVALLVLRVKNNHLVAKQTERLEVNSKLTDEMIKLLKEHESDLLEAKRILKDRHD